SVIGDLAVSGEALGSLGRSERRPIGDGALEQRHGVLVADDPPPVVAGDSHVGEHGETLVEERYLARDDTGALQPRIDLARPVVEDRSLDPAGDGKQKCTEEGYDHTAMRNRNRPFDDRVLHSPPDL